MANNRIFVCLFANGHIGSKGKGHGSKCVIVNNLSYEINIQTYRYVTFGILLFCHRTCDNRRNRHGYVSEFS